MRHRTIVADPPWDYGRNESFSITCGGKGPKKHTPFAYRTMSVEDIASLPVGDLAERDCRLFLWATNRHLPASFMVAESWGFRYCQTLVWRKTGNPSPFGGSVAPNHAEYLVVCRRGSPPVSARLASSVVDCPAAVFGHSAKPEAFLDMVEQVSPGPYLEMFARRNRLGWDTWGNECLEHVSVPHVCCG